MSDDLVELVVQLYEKNWGVRDYGLARAVVAMCMEEAAKVVTEHYQELCAEHRLLLLNRAAAIRALKEPT